MFINWSGPKFGAISYFTPAVLKNTVQQMYIFYIYQQIYDKIIAHEFCSSLLIIVDIFFKFIVICVYNNFLI